MCHEKHDGLVAFFRAMLWFHSGTVIKHSEHKQLGVERVIQLILLGQGRNSRSENEGGSREERFLWLTHIIQGHLPEDWRYTPAVS